MTAEERAAKKAAEVAAKKGGAGAKGGAKPPEEPAGPDAPEGGTPPADAPATPPAPAAVDPQAEFGDGDPDDKGGKAVGVFEAQPNGSKVLIRSYSLVDHGKIYKKLAAQFVAKNNDRGKSWFVEPL